MANNDLNAFKRRLARIPAAARKQANEEVKKQAIALGSTMMSVVPVDKGDLKKSIRFQMQELRAFVKAGGNATTKRVRRGATAYFDYALAQEYGTSQHPAQPFFWPTYRLKRSQIKAAINKSIKKGIEDSFSK